MTKRRTMIVSGSAMGTPERAGCAIDPNCVGERAGLELEPNGGLEIEPNGLYFGPMADPTGTAHKAGLDIEPNGFAG